MPQPLRVLFLCTGNSARSQMAEALLNHEGKGRFHAESAGSRPVARVNPHAIRALADVGISWEGHAPRGMDGLEREMWDIVITVCDSARDACPVFAGRTLRTHWDMEDPAAVDGTAGERQHAFDVARDLLARRIRYLTSLPVDQLGPAALADKLAAAGRLQ